MPDTPHKEERITVDTIGAAVTIVGSIVLLLVAIIVKLRTDDDSNVLETPTAPTGATHGPWATHGPRCACTVCR